MNIPATFRAVYLLPSVIMYGVSGFVWALFRETGIQPHEILGNLTHFSSAVGLARIGNTLMLSIIALIASGVAFFVLAADAVRNPEDAKNGYKSEEILGFTVVFGFMFFFSFVAGMRLELHEYRYVFMYGIPALITTWLMHVVLSGKSNTRDFECPEFWK